MDIQLPTELANAHPQDFIILKSLSTPPAFPVRGLIFLNDQLGMLQFYDGSNWRTINII